MSSHFKEEYVGKLVKLLGMSSHFQEEYVGKKVLVQTNEKESDLIPAIVDGYDVTGINDTILIIRYRKQSDGSIFYCNSGCVYPDTEEFRKVFNFISTIFPDVKDKFQFICVFRNYFSDMNYFAKNAKDSY